MNLSAFHAESSVDGKRPTALMTDSMAASGPRILRRLWKASAAPPRDSEGNNCKAEKKKALKKFVSDERIIQR